MQIKKKEVLLKEIIKILDDNKAKDIVTIDLANKSSIADYMIVASGTSSRHIQSVSENTIEEFTCSWSYQHFEASGVNF